MATAKKTAEKKPAQENSKKKAAPKAAPKAKAAVKADPEKKASTAKKAPAAKKATATKKAAPAEKAAPAAKKAASAKKAPVSKKAPPAPKATKAKPAEVESVNEADATDSGKSPVRGVAQIAAEKLGIGSDELEKTVEKLKANAQTAQSALADYMKLLNGDLQAGIKRMEAMAIEAKKGAGNISAEDMSKNLEKLSDGFEKLGEKAVDAAVLAGAEAKKNIAQAKTLLNGFLAKYKK